MNYSTWRRPSFSKFHQHTLAGLSAHGEGRRLVAPAPPSLSTAQQHRSKMKFAWEGPDLVRTPADPAGLTQLSFPHKGWCMRERLRVSSKCFIVILSLDFSSIYVIYRVRIGKQPVWKCCNNSGIIPVRIKLLFHHSFRPRFSNTLTVGAEGSLWKLNSRLPCSTYYPSSLNWILNSLFVTGQRRWTSTAHLRIHICMHSSTSISPATWNWQAWHLFPYFLVGFCGVQTKKYFSSKSSDRSMETFLKRTFSHVIRTLSTSMSSHVPVNFSTMRIFKKKFF